MKKWIFIAFLSLLINQNAFASDTTAVKETVYRFKKGRHFAKPRGIFNRFVWQPQSLKWKMRFDTSCQYILKNKNGQIHEDQFDWLKLCGVTFSPWQPRKNTAMVGWRYNHIKKVFELNTYWHVNGKRIFEDTQHIDVKANEDFETEIILNPRLKKITVVIKTQNGRLEQAQNYRFFRKNWATVIHPFFGGTSKAPRNMKLVCSRIIPQ